MVVLWDTNLNCSRWLVELGLGQSPIHMKMHTYKNNKVEIKNDNFWALYLHWGELMAYWKWKVERERDGGVIVWKERVLAGLFYFVVIRVFSLVAVWIFSTDPFEVWIGKVEHVSTHSSFSRNCLVPKIWSRDKLKKIQQTHLMSKLVISKDLLYYHSLLLRTKGITLLLQYAGL